MVDHIRAHKGNMLLFWDKTNWQPMRKGCNSRKAVRTEGGFGRMKR
jgi:5-methylcytosine-specific restriction protein A